MAFSDAATVTITVTAATPTYTVLTHIPVGNGPSAVAFSPDGTKAYVTNATDHTVSVIDTVTHTVIDTNIATLAADPIRVPNTPMGVVVSPNGSQVYVTSNAEDRLTMIDVTPSTPSVTSVRLLNAQTPVGVVLSPDGSRVYVASRHGGVSVINPITGAVIDTNPATTDRIDPIAVGLYSEALAISPSGDRSTL